MTESKLREGLLKQNDGSSLEVELKTLNHIVDMEYRRVRRLRYWTIGIWVAWLLTVVVMFGGYSLLVEETPPVPAEGQQQEQPVQNPSGAGMLMAFIGVPLMFASFLILPIVGVVLLILLFLSPRTASAQIRSSIGAIDSHLREMAGKKKDGG